MDGGLAIFGLGLFLLSIAGLYVRSAYGLAGFLFATALISMGMAFSESKRLPNVSLGLGAALLAASGVGVVAGVLWWMVLGTFLFSVAFFVLWAEFHFRFFGNLKEGPSPDQEPARWPFHWPRRAHRS